jgi:hypothetical protein
MQRSDLRECSLGSFSIFAERDLYGPSYANSIKKKKKGNKVKCIKWKEKKHTSALTFSLPSIGRSHTTINPSSVFTTSIGNVYWLRVASTNRKAESILKAKIKSEIKPIYLHNSSYHTTIL